MQDTPTCDDTVLTADRIAGRATAVFDCLDALPQRVRDIAALRGLGYTHREIARQLGKTPQAISIMLVRHRRTLKTLGANRELEGLSARACNVLSRHGIKSRAEALGSDLPGFLAQERNCGAKTQAEIERWLATPPHGRTQQTDAPDASGADSPDHVAETFPERFHNNSLALPKRSVHSV